MSSYLTSQGVYIFNGIELTGRNAAFSLNGTNNTPRFNRQTTGDTDGMTADCVQVGFTVSVSLDESTAVTDEIDKILEGSGKGNLIFAHRIAKIGWAGEVILSDGPISSSVAGANTVAYTFESSVDQEMLFGAAAEFGANAVTFSGGTVGYHYDASENTIAYVTSAPTMAADDVVVYGMAHRPEGMI